MVYVPTDIVVDILGRLPSASRRRLRLVCRTWRDLVHQRTSTEIHKCQDAVPLVVTTESAYLLHEVGIGSSKTCEVWRSGMDIYKRREVVGVCNGLLCLCNDGKPGGAITLANPATGDVLALPPVPRDGLFRRHNTRCSRRSWHQAYTFGYNHERGQYKVVHVPCFFKTKDALHVFTLGEVSWREVPAPTYARCKLDAGIITVNGATYWVAEGSEDRIMSIDLESEQVTCTKPLPMSSRPVLHLTKVHRKLSVATTTHRYGYASIQVWALESKRKEQTWIHLYRLTSCPWSGPKQQMTRPYFIHGKYFLMDMGDHLAVYRHKPTDYYGWKSECTAVHDNTCGEKILVSTIRGDICRAFAYVKTKEALSTYRRW